MKIYRKRKILYLVGILLLTAGVLGFAEKIIPVGNDGEAPYEVEACGVERWSVKVFTDADASKINITPVKTTIDSLIHIKTPYPDPNMARQACEKQVYTIHCLLKEVKLESDGDYHLTVGDSQGNAMITEIADPTCSSTTSSIYLGNLIQCRQFIDKHYTVTGSFQTVNKRVVISGVTFVDPPHGQTDAAPNNIEIHSILNIDFEQAHNSGIAESNAENRQISAFPNPFSTEVSFSMSFNGQPRETVILRVFDLKGQVVRTINWPVNESVLSIQRGDLPKGIYFYQFTEGDNVSDTGKIMAL